MLKDLRQTFIAWRDTVEKLERQLEDKRQRLEFLQESPLPPDELAESIITTMLTHARSSFYGNLEMRLAPAVHSPLDDPETRQWRPSLISKLTTPGDCDPWCLLWLLREPITAAIRQEVTDWPGLPEAGPPLAKRKAEIEKLQKDIAQLSADLETERQAAREAGVELAGIHQRDVPRKKKSRPQ